MRRLVVCSMVVWLLAGACSRPDRAVDERAGNAAPSSSVVEPTPIEGRPFDSPDGLAQGRPRIVVLGDSLTAGYGLQRSQSVPALMQKRLDAEGYNYEVVNQGVSGDTSAGGVSRLEYALNGDVRVLIIELGGNDGLRGLPVEATKQNLSQIIAGATMRGVRVLLTGMEAPPSHGPAYTSAFRQVFTDLAREHKVAFMPFFLDGVAGNPALNQGDGIHPTAEGAVIVERTLWKTLEPLLDQKDRPKADRTATGR